MGEVLPGEDLAALLAAAAPKEIGDSHVLVVAHKVVSKAEGRVRSLAAIEPGEDALHFARQYGKDPRVVQAVLDETVRVVRSGHGVMICETRHGLVCANAGVDRSNTSEADTVLLLPREPDRSARELRAGIAAARGVWPAVVISDSFGRPWRLGQTDFAIGAAGLAALDDWRGRADGRGRELEATEIAVADAVATAADLARSKDSREPAVLVHGLGRFVTEEDGHGAAALRRRPEEDLFR